MDLTVWILRSLHLLAASVWFGGTISMAVVSLPVARREHIEFTSVAFQAYQRHAVLTWSALVVIVLSGIGLFLSHEGVAFMQFRDRVSILLAAKLLMSLGILASSLAYGRMAGRLQERVLAGGETPLDQLMPPYRKMLRTGRITIVLGAIALVLAAGLH